MGAFLPDLPHRSLLSMQQIQNTTQIRNRLSFRDFIGLNFSDRVPDAKTIWLFAEQLKQLDLEQELFDCFAEELVRQGLEAKSGSISDGSFVAVPKQRNTRGENKQIKSCEVPERIAANPHVLAQKALDAEWAKKGDKLPYGCKNHVTIDEEHKLIRGYGVTGTAAHDSVPYLDVLRGVCGSGGVCGLGIFGQGY